MDPTENAEPLSDEPAPRPSLFSSRVLEGLGLLGINFVLAVMLLREQAPSHAGHDPYRKHFDEFCCEDNFLFVQFARLLPLLLLALLVFSALLAPAGGKGARLVRSFLTVAQVLVGLAVLISAVPALTGAAVWTQGWANILAVLLGLLTPATAFFSRPSELHPEPAATPEDELAP